MDTTLKVKDNNFEIIAKVMAKCMFYGKWVAETPNERVIEILMRREGLYPFKDEDTMIEKTKIDEKFYVDALEYFKPQP